MFPEIDKEKTGDRIRFFMELRGLTVKDVCKALSLGCVQAVYKWMDGVNLPSLAKRVFGYYKKIRNHAAA